MRRCAKTFMLVKGLVKVRSGKARLWCLVFAMLGRAGPSLVGFRVGEARLSQVGLGWVGLGYIT